MRTQVGGLKARNRRLQPLRYLVGKGVLTGQWAEGSPPQHRFPSGLLGGTVVALSHPMEARAFPGLAIALIRVPEGQEASSGTWLAPRAEPARL